MSTTVNRMRATVLLLILATLLAACGDSASGGGSGGEPGGEPGGGSSREQVEATTTGHAKEAVPLASEALAASSSEIYTQWRSCMAVSWRYSVFGNILAPEADPDRQLERVRQALVEAGYDDITQVEGGLRMQRDGTTVVVEQPTPVYGPEVWKVSVDSECASYDGDDEELVENDTPTLLEGLGR